MEDYWCPTFLLPFVFAVTSLQLPGRLTYPGRWQWLEKSSGIVSPSVLSSEKVEGERSRSVSKPDVTPNVWCVAANICANLSLRSLLFFSFIFLILLNVMHIGKLDSHNSHVVIKSFSAATIIQNVFPCKRQTAFKYNALPWIRFYFMCSWGNFF